MRDLVAAIDVMNIRYLNYDTYALRSSQEFGAHCDEIFGRLGPQLWPSPPIDTSGWLVDAAVNDWEGKYTRNLVYEHPFDRATLCIKFFDLLVAKCLRYNRDHNYFAQKKATQDSDTVEQDKEVLSDVEDYGMSSEDSPGPQSEMSTASWGANAIIRQVNIRKRIQNHSGVANFMAAPVAHMWPIEDPEVDRPVKLRKVDEVLATPSRLSAKDTLSSVHPTIRDVTVGLSHADETTFFQPNKSSPSNTFEQAPRIIKREGTCFTDRRNGQASVCIDLTSDSDDDGTNVVPSDLAKHNPAPRPLPPFSTTAQPFLDIRSNESSGLLLHDIQSRNDEAAQQLSPSPSIHRRSEQSTVSPLQGSDFVHRLAVVDNSTRRVDPGISNGREQITRIKSEPAWPSSPDHRQDGTTNANEAEQRPDTMSLLGVSSPESQALGSNYALPTPQVGGVTNVPDATLASTTTGTEAEKYFIFHLSSPKTKGQQPIRIGTNCGVNLLFAKVQVRMHLRLKGKQPAWLMLRLPNQSLDEEPYRIERDDSEGWQIFLELASELGGDRVKITGVIEV